MRKTIVAIFAVLALLLTACGGAQEEQEQFEPAAYGNDRTEQCYFVEDPREVEALKAEGKCEDDWNPAPWPEDEFSGFFPFFFFAGGLDGDRHHYTKRYVPKDKHAAYGKRLTTLNSNPAFKQKVAVNSPKAVYKSTTSGKTITGDKVNRGQFGGGTRAGNNGTRKCALSASGADASLVLAKGGGGGSRGGGGGTRSGGGGSKPGGSKPGGSKSKTGC